MRNWIQVSKIEETPGVPIAASTAYKWWHINRFPELFVKVGGKLFLDLDKLYAMAEERKLQ